MRFLYTDKIGCHTGQPLKKNRPGLRPAEALYVERYNVSRPHQLEGGTDSHRWDQLFSQ